MRGQGGGSGSGGGGEGGDETRSALPVAVPGQVVPKVRRAKSVNIHRLSWRSAGRRQDKLRLKPERLRIELRLQSEPLQETIRRTGHFLHPAALDGRRTKRARRAGLMAWRFCVALKLDETFELRAAAVHAISSSCGRRRGIESFQPTHGPASLTLNLASWH